MKLTLRLIQRRVERIFGQEKTLLKSEKLGKLAQSDARANDCPGRLAGLKTSTSLPRKIWRRSLSHCDYRPAQEQNKVSAEAMLNRLEVTWNGSMRIGRRPYRQPEDPTVKENIGLLSGTAGNAGAGC